jgi:hypothetical protein
MYIVNTTHNMMTNLHIANYRSLTYTEMVAVAVAVALAVAVAVAVVVVGWC